METSNYSSEAQISMKKAVIIILMTIVVVVAIGFVVGYRFFWDQYPTITKADKEMTLAQETLKKYPNNPVAHVQMALRYLSMGDNKKAIEGLEKAYKLDKKNIPARLYLGIAYKEDKRYDEAEKLLLEIVKENPVNLLGVVNLGMVRYEKKDYKKALESFDSAITINPGAADIYVLRGKTFAAMGKKDKALADIDKALKFVPDFQEALDAKKEIAGN